MELYNLTAHEVSKKLRNKEVSVKDVVNSTFDRIEEMESLQKNVWDVFHVLYEINEIEEEGFPYDEEEGILYLKETI